MKKLWAHICCVFETLQYNRVCVCVCLLSEIIIIRLLLLLLLLLLLVPLLLFYSFLVIIFFLVSFFHSSFLFINFFLVFFYFYFLHYHPSPLIQESFFLFLRLALVAFISHYNTFLKTTTTTTTIDLTIVFVSINRRLSHVRKKREWSCLRRKVIGPKRVEVTRGRRKKHDDEPRNLNSHRFIRMVKLEQCLTNWWEIYPTPWTECP
jgi:hypothetical protein